MSDFGPLKVHNCSIEVFNKVLEKNPDADMRAIPNEWLLKERALSQSLSDRIAELEAKVERLEKALTIIRDDPCCDVEMIIKVALEGKQE